VEFGISGANVGPFATARGAEVMARGAEAAGFDSIWTFEHVVAPRGYESRYPYSRTGRAPMLEEVDLPDPVVWLSWAGAHTTTLRLGTGILILPQRNPVVLAKELATLDALSGGRVRLGIGVGWLREEFEALDVPFERRGARTDEHVEALRALWGADAGATYHGEFVSFDDCVSLPSPPGGTVPITVGGHSEAAARRAGRLGDGYFPAIDAETVATGGITAALDRLEHLVDLARRTAEEHDRDPDALEVTVNWSRVPSPEMADRLRAMGADRLVVFSPTADLDVLPEALGELHQELAAA
jgi:probable F420-dependent oxidoreductase